MCRILCHSELWRRISVFSPALLFSFFVVKFVMFMTDSRPSAEGGKRDYKFESNSRYQFSKLKRPHYVNRIGGVFILANRWLS